MILQALTRYYERLSSSGDEDVPSPGFSRQEIHFCLVLDGSGNLVDVKDLRKKEGNRLVGTKMLVPAAVKRTSGPKSNFLWDNAGYVLGLDAGEKGEGALRKLELFRELHRDLGSGVEDGGMKAVLRFLDSRSPADNSGMSLAGELPGQNIVFRLDGELRYVHERPQVRSRWLEHWGGDAGEERSLCLVTGEESSIPPIHSSIKGVAGAQTSGASLISFNCPSFRSYGKEQNLNSPIGKDAAFAYTTALNWLLRSESRQKIRIGDATVVFWTEKKTIEESLLAELLDPAISAEGLGDSEDRTQTANLRIILDAARRGRIQEAIKEPGVPFYILGLSPNNARLSVRFWHPGTVGEIMENLGRHFRDMAIAPSFDSDPEYPSIRMLLRETVSRKEKSSPLEKDQKVPPLLAGAFTRSVLAGALYPQSLFSALLMRMRTDQTFNYLRACLVKACLVRNYNHTEVAVSLDRDNINSGYRLGRLFAVLERVQTAANPGISSTIRDKYFGSASATPRNVFPMLVALAQQHLGKLRRDSAKRGLAGFFDSRLEEIVSALPPSALPAFLDPESQGLFVIGYYHQRQDLFSAKAEPESEPEENEEE